MSEKWLCLDCLQFDTLYRDGNCSRCGSQAVVSEHHGAPLDPPVHAIQEMLLEIARA